MSVLTLAPARNIGDTGRGSRRLMSAPIGGSYLAADRAAESEDEARAMQQGSGHDEQAQSQNQQGERPFRCQYPGCSKAFKKRNKLNRHAQSHSDERKYACQHPGCDKKFLRSQHLAAHQQTHSGPSSPRASETWFVCSHKVGHGKESTCGKRFPTKQKLERHINSVHEILPSGDVESRAHDDTQAVNGSDKLYCCDHAGCNLFFRKRKHLRAHVWDMHSDAPHLSPYSRAKLNETADPPSASQSGTTDEEKRPFSCSWPGCTMRFPSNSHRRVHEQRHEAKKAKIYTCALSHGPTLGSEILTFSTWSLFRAHMREAHPPRCSHAECQDPHTGLGRAFKSKDGLKAHLRRHEERAALLAAEEEALSADDSEDDLDQDEQGAQQAEVNSPYGDPEKTGYRFACADVLADGSPCPKRFKTSRALECHHRVFHLGERRFQCSRGCGKRFGYKHTQERHEAAGKCSSGLANAVETPSSEFEDDYFREEGGAVPERDSGRGAVSQARSILHMSTVGAPALLSEVTSSTVKAAAEKLTDATRRALKMHPDRVSGSDAFKHSKASSATADLSLFQLFTGEGYTRSTDALTSDADADISALTQKPGHKRGREDEDTDGDEIVHHGHVKRRRKVRERTLACPWRRIIELGRAAQTLDPSATGDGPDLGKGPDEESDVDAADEGGPSDCAFRFSRMYDLRRHVLSKHGVDLTRFDKEALAAIMDRP